MVFAGQTITRHLDMLQLDLGCIQSQETWICCLDSSSILKPRRSLSAPPAQVWELAVVSVPQDEQVSILRKGKWGGIDAVKALDACKGDSQVLTFNSLSAKQAGKCSPRALELYKADIFKSSGHFLLKLSLATNTVLSTPSVPPVGNPKVCISITDYADGKGAQSLCSAGRRTGMAWPKWSLLTATSPAASHSPASANSQTPVLLPA